MGYGKAYVEVICWTYDGMQISGENWMENIIAKVLKTRHFYVHNQKFQAHSFLVTITKLMWIIIVAAHYMYIT